MGLSRMRRRAFLGGACAGALLPIAATPALGTTHKLHVLLDTMLDSRAMKNLLSDALPSVEVVVFGRSRDFEHGMSDAPQAVLARSVVLESLGLKPALQGLRGDSEVEPFVLLAEAGVNAMSALALGAVDILGRRRMPEFVRRLVGAAREVVPVTRVMDLLPLLQFKKVQAVLLSQREADRLKGLTRMTLAATKLEGSGVGLPAVFLSATGSGLKQAFRSLEGRGSLHFGVERWR
jgi:hypothetical protein